MYTSEKPIDFEYGIKAYPTLKYIMMLIKLNSYWVKQQIPFITAIYDILCHYTLMVIITMTTWLNQLCQCELVMIRHNLPTLWWIMFP